MTPSAEDLVVARRFLEVVPPVLHELRHCAAGPPGPSITFAQVRCLLTLARGPSSLRDLAARHAVAPATMSGIVDLLVAKGLVERTDDPKDRRCVVLSLTPSGRRVSDGMMTQFAGGLATVVAHLTADERRGLLLALSGLERVAKWSRP